MLEEHILIRRKRAKKCFKTKKISGSNTDENVDIPSLSEVFMCTKCTKTYRLKHSLVRHSRFECGQDPKYPCDKCDKRFKHKYDLKIHAKYKHSGNTSINDSLNGVMTDITNNGN
ncbi:hypothetical protein HHI36_020028 [Cryptolaemus montrouzieri]|uniref:C2H2-type domain-containing protein n=1 Tax=Cryptolaemus montrouzieri TaxID=559131 RepID=A0ABD2N9G1_9CUCU